MNKDLIFYTNPQSRGRIVRWMLEETGASYHTELVEYGPEMKSPAYRAINPMGKVPALVAGDTVITECAAICAWLADAYPDAGLAPPPADRGAYYRWLFFAAGPVEQAVMARFMGLEPDEKQQMTLGFGNYGEVMDTLDSAIEAALASNGYLAGERFTAVDVYVGSHVGWGLQFGTIDKRPAFETYWARVSDRDAYRQATALDDEAMKDETTG